MLNNIHLIPKNSQNTHVLNYSNILKIITNITCEIQFTNNILQKLIYLIYALFAPFIPPHFIQFSESQCNTFKYQLFIPHRNSQSQNEMEWSNNPN